MLPAALVSAVSSAAASWQGLHNLSPSVAGDGHGKGCPCCLLVHRQFSIGATPPVKILFAKYDIPTREVRVVSREGIADRATLRSRKRRNRAIWFNSALHEPQQEPLDATHALLATRSRFLSHSSNQARITRWPISINAFRVTFRASSLWMPGAPIGTLAGVLRIPPCWRTPLT